MEGETLCLIKQRRVKYVFSPWTLKRN